MFCLPGRVLWRLYQAHSHNANTHTHAPLLSLSNVSVFFRQSIVLCVNYISHCFCCCCLTDCEIQRPAFLFSYWEINVCVAVAKFKIREPNKKNVTRLPLLYLCFTKKVLCQRVFFWFCFSISLANISEQKVIVKTKTTTMLPLVKNDKPVCIL